MLVTIFKNLYASPSRPYLQHLLYLSSGSLPISPPKVLSSSCRPFHVQQKWIIRGSHHQSIDFVGSWTFWDCRKVDGGELQDATKLSDAGRMLAVAINALEVVQLLWTHVLQAPDKNISRYSNALWCSSILQYIIMAQHPLTRGPRSDFQILQVSSRRIECIAVFTL